MTTRTTFRTVTFTEPFTFEGLDEVLPPGEYTIETDSELLEGISFPAYRRLTTLIHLPVNARQGGSMRLLAVNPGELDALLARDSAAQEVQVRNDAARQPPYLATRDGADGEPAP